MTSRIIAFGGVVTLAALALTVLVLEASALTRDSFHWVTHSAEVIETAGRALGEMRGAESAERGFIISHDPVFAASVDTHIANSLRLAAAAAAMTVDNPAQNARARRIHAAIVARGDVLRQGFALALGGDYAGAGRFVAHGPGRALMLRLAAHVEEFLEQERRLRIQRVALAESRLAQVQRRAAIGGSLIALFAMLMCVLLVKGLRRPAMVIKAAMTAFGAGESHTRIAGRMGSREFGDLADGYNLMADQLETAIVDQGRSERELQRANEELVLRSDALRDRSRVIGLLGEMAHRMQAARTEEELAQVIHVFVPRVLPGLRGVLYAHNNSRNLLAPITGWGGLDPASEGFKPDQCWALRRGQGHFVGAPDSDVVCAHVASTDIVYADADHPDHGYHCQPLLAGGEVIGTLYLDGRFDGDARSHLTVLAEHIASALFNHRLQRGLREQTIRDPLTGLYNRRYMEESLAMEIARVRRSDQPLSLVMGDVDLFKRFNDEFGHDAGDAVLRAVAAELRARFRDGDVVCRLGGEEFVVIAPGSTAEALARRVEVVRQAISQISLHDAGQALGAISMSFGIADWHPAMDRAGQDLLKAADVALYAAKRAGRNRAMINDRQAA